jgi:hypothetical protein
MRSNLMEISVLVIDRRDVILGSLEIVESPVKVRPHRSGNCHTST